MYQKLALDYQNSLASYHPFAPITNRTIWNALDETYRTICIQKANESLGYSYPYLSATDYLNFTRTGNRTDFENPYFAKRNTLNLFVIAECLENQGRFLDDILNGIYAICDEMAWQLPPHNSYIRDTPQLPLPDTTRPVLDLFACETGALLAMIYSLLQPALDKISPFICKRILSILDERIITPYLSTHFWWMGRDKESMCNWTIWCTQNVLLTTFLTPQTDSTKRAVFEKSAKSTDYFLKEYGNDGCCDEGAQYYHHSGLCLFLTTELLNAVSANAFLSVYQEEKIKNIASYIFKVHIGDKYYVNFADCSPVAGRAGMREFLLAKQTCNPDMMCYAASDFAIATNHFSNEKLLLEDEINLTYRLLTLFHLNEMKQFLSTNKAASGRVFHHDIYFSSVGLFLCRDSHFFLAAKAGDNADSHNHNDTGSFTIYKDGVPLLIDVGVESYTKKTFSPERYEIWTMQSAYHNLPTINGYQQKDGANYRATDVQVEQLTDHATISMELNKAYPTECGIASYIRAVSLQKEKCITITDRFSFEQDAPNANVVLSLMTYDRPVASSTHSIVIGTHACLHFDCDCTIQIEELPITDPRLKTAWEHALYRILLTPSAKQITLQIE